MKNVQCNEVNEERLRGGELPDNTKLMIEMYLWRCELMKQNLSKPVE